MTSSKRVLIVLSFQIVFILLDVVINVASPFIKCDKLLITFLFILQDFGVILAFSSIILNIYSSQMYRVEMADILYRKYRICLVVILIYFILCIRSHVWTSFNYQLIEKNAEWPLYAIILHNLQRFFSPIYYYSFKKTCLEMTRISDKLPSHYLSGWNT